MIWEKMRLDTKYINSDLCKIESTEAQVCPATLSNGKIMNLGHVRMNKSKISV